MSSSRAREFLERLHDRVLICDGAMGTQLYARGYSYRSCFEELNETHPEVVAELHREYIAAGATVIETNSFGANPYRLSDYGLEGRVREINRTAAQIARSAAGERVFVAGSVGPLNRMLEPIGKLTLTEARDAFRRQAEGLLEGGVDLFIIETMSSLAEIREAMAAVRELCDLPVIASMTFTEEGKTLVGDKPADVRRALVEWGADVIGANCSVGPQPMLDVIERMAGDRLLAAQPNAGLPRMVGGRYIYLTSPPYFADYARKFVDAGVSLVGGCCGTTPDHIRAMAEAVTGRRRGAVSLSFVHEVVEEEALPAPAVTHEAVQVMRRELGKRFLVSVEIDPPRGTNAEPYLHGARLLKGGGVDLINVADSPLARSRLSALAMAHLIRGETGADVVLHVSCRDRNALALQSELLGAHALGVQNILAVTGDPPAVGDYPFAKAVFELDSIGLCRLVSELKAGRDLTGRAMEEPARFLLGVGVNPTASDLALEYDRFQRKIDAGAEFAFTQPLFDRATLERFLEATSSFRTIPIFVGILPLRSAKHADFIHNEIPDMSVPEAVREAMRKSGSEGLRVGIELAQAFLLEAKPLCQGVYLMPPFNRFTTALDVVKVLADRSLG